MFIKKDEHLTVDGRYGCSSTVQWKSLQFHFFMQTIVTPYLSSHKLEYHLKGKCTKAQWNSLYLDLKLIIWLKFYDLNLKNNSSISLL